MGKNILTRLLAGTFLLQFSFAQAQVQEPAIPAVAIDASQTDNSFTTPSSISGGNPDFRLPAILRADEISHDQELGIIVANGNVEIAQGDRILLADTLSYSQRTNIVTASGNVIIMEPKGDVLFASYVELDDNLQQGIIEEIKILLSNNARISANGAKRTGGNRTDMVKAVYSPCEICKETPGRPPVWQIKARRIIHDQKTRQVEYRSAVMEIGGLPAFYTPYFSHPDPTVKRQTGFLMPRIGNQTDAGIYVQIPYFIVLDDSKDITLDPIYTADEGLFYSGEYRQHFNSGEIKISGSLGTADRAVGQRADGSKIVKTNEWRGHVFAKGKFDIDPTWRTGFDINRSTDQSYLKKFNFWTDPGNAMTSNLFVEGFRHRNYISANAYSFQDLKPGMRPDTPLILPLLDYNGLGQKDDIGGRWSLDGNFRMLQRDDSADSLRSSIIGGYEIPFTANAGYVTTFTASARGDIYYMNQNSSLDKFERRVTDGSEMRIHGNLGVDWRYPLARSAGWGYQIFEPVVALFVAPDSKVTKNIRNEDSTVIESDDTNLFSANRAPGLDIIEGGVRTVYGMKIANYFNNNDLFSAFIGQSYKFTDESAEFIASTLLEEHRSDILGRMSLNMEKYLDINYRFAMDKDNYEFNQNEIGFSAGIPAFKISGDYTFVHNKAKPNTIDIEEIRLSAMSKINNFWRIQADITRDLRNAGKTRKTGLGISYEDECLILSAQANRNYTSNLNLSNSDSFFLTITFKTLGELNLS